MGGNLLVRAGYGRHRLRLDNRGLIGPVAPRLERHRCGGRLLLGRLDGRQPGPLGRVGADDLTGQHQPCPIRLQRVPRLLQDGPRRPGAGDRPRRVGLERNQRRPGLRNQPPEHG